MYHLIFALLEISRLLAIKKKLMWDKVVCRDRFAPENDQLFQGVIRDFAGPYYVSEDNMAFGNPTR